jgi:hypothetical protein
VLDCGCCWHASLRSDSYHNGCMDALRVVPVCNIKDWLVSVCDALPITSSMYRPSLAAHCSSDGGACSSASCSAVHGAARMQCFRVRLQYSVSTARALQQPGCLYYYILTHVSTGRQARAAAGSLVLSHSTRAVQAVRAVRLLSQLDAGHAILGTPIA